MGHDGGVLSIVFLLVWAGAEGGQGVLSKALANTGRCTGCCVRFVYVYVYVQVNMYRGAYQFHAHQTGVPYFHIPLHTHHTGLPTQGEAGILNNTPNTQTIALFKNALAAVPVFVVGLVFQEGSALVCNVWGAYNAWGAYKCTCFPKGAVRVVGMMILMRCLQMHALPYLPLHHI